MIINVTDSAKTHIVNVLKNMDKPYLVFGLKGGGCAGFEYFWEPADQEIYEKKVTKYGNGAKLDAPKRHIGKRAYIIILKK